MCERRVRGRCLGLGEVLAFEQPLYPAVDFGMRHRLVGRGGAEDGQSGVWLGAEAGRGEGVVSHFQFHVVECYEGAWQSFGRNWQAEYSKECPRGQGRELGGRGSWRMRWRQLYSDAETAPGEKTVGGLYLLMREHRLFVGGDHHIHTYTFKHNLRPS